MRKAMAIAGLLASAAFAVKAEEPQAVIARILANPAELAGKFVTVQGVVTRVEPTAAYVFYYLDDGSGAEIKVRTAKAGRVQGELYTVRGRVRNDPLLGQVYIVEEDIDLQSEPVAQDAALAQSSTSRTDSDLGIPVNQPASAFPPRDHPVASAPAPAEAGGVYAVVFKVAPDAARDPIISELGRLAVGVVHPTCNYQRSQIVCDVSGTGGGPIVHFRSSYGCLLLGDREMLWDLVFDAEGQVADVVFVADSSPLTNVGLLNEIKSQVISFLKDQLQELQRQLAR